MSLTKIFYSSFMLIGISLGTFACKSSDESSSSQPAPASTTPPVTTMPATGSSTAGTTAGDALPAGTPAATPTTTTGASPQAAFIPPGCYRIGATGFLSRKDKIGYSCPFLATQMPTLCNGLTVSSFSSLPEYTTHQGNIDEGVACK